MRAKHLATTVSFDSDADYRRRLSEVTVALRDTTTLSLTLVLRDFPRLQGNKDKLKAAISSSTPEPELRTAISSVYKDPADQDRVTKRILDTVADAKSLARKIEDLLVECSEVSALIKEIVSSVPVLKRRAVQKGLRDLASSTPDISNLQPAVEAVLKSHGVSIDLGEIFKRFCLEEQLRRHPDLQSRLAVVTQYTTSKWLLEQELRARGSIQPGASSSSVDAYEVAREVKSVGVCFSGGGIRSATFNLGILQGLAQLKVLGKITYLSTVSGGGYIHQFLASWIYREKFNPVERQLRPIPEPGTQRIQPPEPIRWLRRYSNYLSPSISMFGADVWSIVTVWARNTALNLVILISAISGLLLIPHVAVTKWALGLASPPALAERLAIFTLLALCALASAALLYHSFPRYCAKQEADGTKPSRDCRKDYTRVWHPYAIVVAWLAVSICLAPVVYRLSLPEGSSFSKDANKAYTHPPAPAESSSQLTLKVTDELSKAELRVCDSKGEGCNHEANKATWRLADAWRTYKPGCITPKFLTGFIPCQAMHKAYVEHHLAAGDRPRSMESPLLWLYDSYPILCFFFCFAVWFAQKETASRLVRTVACLCPVAGGLLSAALLFGIEFVFFAATFLVDQKRITSLGIALLPSLLVAVPFISLELCTGLFGTLLGSAQREWIARLRAVSILIGGGWFVLFGLSLLGPYVFGLIAHIAIVKYAVWSTWVVGSVTGVVLGKSRSTNGNPNAGSGADTSSTDSESPTKTSHTAEIIVRVAPPLFAIGLFVLISAYLDWLLQGPDKNFVTESIVGWGAAFLATVVTALLFSWRIDVNEFSMNAFYRDRLARCYGGASNVRRKPNAFTGFDVAEGQLRVKQLLPTGWSDVTRSSTGTYEGPFAIFCTALNLTTGRELAYQERKAASFAITPLFSGYSTGWTDGKDCSLQYNGYVPTTDHMKKGKGITVSSAVAISGAAASPNMGYHSSTAMSFLMTIFNVRLGWWVPNTRRWAPDSPVLGLRPLINELTGSTNDTSSYVYLSDGGHFDNMGLYELLRRRCRTIIVCDAEEDHDLRFEGIGMAIRKARIDFGVEVNVKGAVGVPTTNPITPAVVPNMQMPPGAEGLMEFKHFPGNLYHALEGEIRYPEDGPDDTPAKLLYIKSTLTGDEPADILNYHRIHPAFPFDTTANQFYTESQFESYRRLGQHILLKDQIKDWVMQNVV